MINNIYKKMRTHKKTPLGVIRKRYRRRLKSGKKQKERNRNKNALYSYSKLSPLEDYSYETIFNKWAPVNLKYLLDCEKSDFHHEKITENIPNNGGNFEVPVEFSITERPKESFDFIRGVLGALITQKYKTINIDYSRCKKLDSDAQVLLDIILKDVIKFFNRCKRYKRTKPKVKEINGINTLNNDVKKLLYSIGSPTIHSFKSINFPDIIPYKLCIHDSETNGDPVKIREQKDLDTSKLVDYVIDSLAALNRTLTPEKIDDLSTVIGEILINAEEHSTTKHRFSIGYFHEMNENGNHFGVFRLTILNFGKTIYEKFKDPDCPNKRTVKNMEALSTQYTKRRFFFPKAFEEETLWTLYALQEGVTSVASDQYLKRGNGSIQFIESFFNIKSESKLIDNFSTLSILSGNTSIVFDGTYGINSKKINGEKYKFMTFNTSGDIENKPDSNFVKFVDNYFPGTIISAKIMFEEDGLTKTYNYETE